VGSNKIDPHKISDALLTISAVDREDLALLPNNDSFPSCAELQKEQVFHHFIGRFKT
jgi:hypothetical protein